MMWSARESRPEEAVRRTRCGRDRLFRHDRLIAWNSLRATFVGWHDRVLASTMLLAALALVRAWFADRSDFASASTALAAGLLLGTWAGRLVRLRLAFHASDGLLAVDALHASIRRRYAAGWLGVGAAFLAVLTLCARPSLLPISVSAYLAGTLVARALDSFALPKRLAGTTRPKWAMRMWLNGRSGGIVAAAVLLLSASSARVLEANVLLAVLGAETLLLGLLMTRVDHATVRFMTIIGLGTRRIVLHHARGIATFLLLSVPGCWAVLGIAVSGIVALTGDATLLLLALRILLYRLHDRRAADLLLSILAGVLMLIAYSLPFALPIAAVAMLWQLRRRAGAKTWLLA